MLGRVDSDALTLARQRSVAEACATLGRIIKVIFTAQGFMKYATETYSSGTPRFHKAIFNDGNEYGAWRFFGGILFAATDLRVLARAFVVTA